MQFNEPRQQQSSARRRLGRRMVAAFALLAIGLVAALLVRTARFKSRQLVVDSAKPHEIDRDGAIERFAGALRYKTVSSPEEFDLQPFEQLHQHLASAFPKTHATLKPEVIGGASLLYRWPGRDPHAKPILLMSHLDVVSVPRGDNGRWRYDPWGGVVADGYVWGRGALDVKCGVTSMLEAVEWLLTNDFQPDCDVYLAFGHDEEVGGADGNLQISLRLRQQGVRLRMALDEGGVIVTEVLPGLERPLALVAVAEKGNATVRLKVNMKPEEIGHSSMPPPQTAVGIVSAALARLEASPRRASLTGPVGTMLDFVGPEMGLPQRIVLANRDIFQPILLSQFERSRSLNAQIRTTTAATTIRGGKSVNVLPSEAEAHVNFRLLPGDTPEAVLAHVRQVIEDDRVACNLIPSASPPSRVSDHEGSDFQTLHRLIRQMDPDVVVAPGLAVVATDSRHYESISDNTFRFLPIRLTKDDLSRIHGIDERISVENYLEMVQFMIRLLQSGGG